MLFCSQWEIICGCCSAVIHHKRKLARVIPGWFFKRETVVVFSTIFSQHWPSSSSSWLGCPKGYCPSNIFWKVTPFQSKIQVVVFCLLVQGKKGAFLTTPHSLTQKTIDTLDTTSQFHNKWGLEDFWVIKIFNPLILPGSVFKRCGTLVQQTLKYINKS